MSEPPPPNPWPERLKRLPRLLFAAVWLLVGKVLRLGYVLLMTVAVILGWLVLTTSGAAWIAERAMEEEPRLSLEVRGGSLWNGLRVADVRWRDEGLDVHVDRADFLWNPLCLLRMRVCAGLLDADGARVEVDTMAMAAAAEAAEDVDVGRPDNDGFSLPVTVGFPDVRIADVDIRVDGHHVAWERLALGGSLRDRSLRLERLDLRGLRVELAEATGTEPAAEVEEGEGIDLAALLDPARRDAVPLPEIELPLDLYLGEAALTDTVVRAGEHEHLITRLELSADLVGSDGVVRRFFIDHTQLTATLDGRFTLAGDYPVDLELTAELRDALYGETLQVEAQLWNSVADLEMRLRADGPGHASLDGSARPLDPALPVDVNLEWSTLGWPLADPRSVYSESGRIRVEGSLEGYRLDAALALRGEDIPEGYWTLQARGDWQGATLERLHGELLGGSLLVAGDVAWVDGLRWDVRLRAETLDASQMLAGAPASIDADISTSGSLVDEQLVLDTAIHRLEAVMHEQMLTAQGEVSHRPEVGWHVRDLRVDAGDSHVHASGRLGERVDLDGSLVLDGLDRFLPELRGSATGRFSARGPLRTPDIELDLDGRDLAWADDVRIAELHLRARVADLAEAASTLQLQLEGVELPGQRIDIGEVRLDAGGTRADQWVSLDIRHAPAELSLALSGTLPESLAWEGTLERARISSAGEMLELQEATAAAWDPDDQQVRMGAHCWVHETGRICAQEDLYLGATGNAAVSVRDYELAALSPWLPEDMSLDGALDADLSARWGDGRLPEVELRMAVGEGSVELLADVGELEDQQETIELAYRDLSLEGSLGEGLLQGRFVLGSGDLGRADFGVSLAIADDGTLGELSGEVSLDGLGVGVLQPFFPEMRTLQGELSLSGTLSGEAADPRFDGRLLFVDGAIETIAVPVELTDIRMTFDVEGNRATLEGGFRSGAGEAEITGHADWSGESWEAEVNLAGDRLELGYDGFATLRASPDLKLSIKPREAALTGRIVIPRANIAIHELPEGAVRVSRDVVIVDDGDGEIPVEEDEIPIPVADGWSFTTDVDIVLGDRVAFEGYGVSGRLTGELGVRQTDIGVLQVIGEIRVVDGRYRAYGQRLIIREGRFLFAGPVDRPEIYIEAVREVPAYNVIAGIRVEGRPDDPRLSLFSEPALPEEEALSYLILGRPIGESGAEGRDMVARAAISLGITQGGGIATSLAEGLGIEEFALDTEGVGDDTRFVISGYLGPNLYLSYGVGVFLPVNKLTLRYRLGTNLYLEGVSSLENAIDLIYTWDF